MKLFHSVPRDVHQRESLTRPQFSVARACNNDCVFCLDDVLKPGRRDRHALPEGMELPAVVAEPVLLPAFLGGHELDQEVCITGLEATTRGDLPEYVAAVRALGFRRVGLVTNGRRLGLNGLAARLVLAGLTRFEVSIHGPDAATHDAATRRPGSFVETLAGLKAALDQRPAHPGLRVEVISVVYRGNLAQLPRTVALLAGLDVDRLTLNVVEPRGEAQLFFENLVPALSEVSAAVVALPRLGVAPAWLWTRPRFTVDGLPPCLMPGMEGLSGNRERVAFADAPGSASLDPRRATGVFAPGCEACLHRPVCLGVYREYAARRGLGEVRPLPFRGGRTPPRDEWLRYLRLFYQRWDEKHRG